MSEPATLNGLKDQADGLRELFGQSAPPVHVVCCPSRPAMALFNFEKFIDLVFLQDQKRLGGQAYLHDAR